MLDNRFMDKNYSKNAKVWIIVATHNEYSALGVPPIRNRIPLVRDSVPPCF